MKKTGKARQKPVLVDVDGVVADFITPVVAYINDRFGKNYVYEDAVFDVRKLAEGLWDEEAEEHVRQPGFAQSLEAYPGAIEGVKALTNHEDVVFLTAPYDKSHTWAWDRYVWLKERFDISRDDIIFAHDKRFVSGVTLIDDRPENVLDWSFYQKKRGLLYRQPWNKEDMPDTGFKTYGKTETGLPRYSHYQVVNNWDQVLDYFKNLD